MDLLLFCDPLKWFRMVGSEKQAEFKPIMLLASIHLARCNSASFQESGFSSANNNMNVFQTRMSSDRFADRTVLYHNNSFIDNFIHGKGK
jgi:hypothetical protein